MLTLLSVDEVESSHLVYNDESRRDAHEYGDVVVFVAELSSPPSQFLCVELP